MLLGNKVLDLIKLMRQIVMGEQVNIVKKHYGLHNPVNFEVQNQMMRQQNPTLMQPKIDPLVDATINDLKMQIRQLAHVVNELVNQKTRGIPVQPVVNPKGEETPQ
ncbi:hypothetical protein DEO72_LG8g2179 [Vigna unguiculata]|uniref:Uncharacterized protein n=1 Tax=Vigna unguiculata TaxID=3917 RepID=A0A4D6MRQ1_VIGUN|nr:hypothetical protein DEO72_LG8g2179 [Vigna unguiculata]